MSWEVDQGLWKEFNLVAGIDEVGRGALFGDVVAACVVLPRGLVIQGVDDSKRLTARRRETLAEQIMDSAIAVGIGRVTAEEIDTINIRQASRLAMRKAFDAMKYIPDCVAIDFEHISLPCEVRAMKHGDAICHAVAAASIIAKVTRDALCAQWEKEYPGYGLHQHKGYATRAHREAILERGPSPMHRRSFLTHLHAPSLFDDLPEDGSETG